MDKSKLLESQLTKNHKKIRMLTTGTSTLDHLLSLGQCPSSNMGLGFVVSTSKSTEVGEHIIFVKEAPEVNKGKQPEKAEHVAVIPQRPHPEKEDRVMLRKRRNGCQFCGKRGYHVRFCYFRRHQYERAWRLNLCYMEPSTYGHVWIAKRDLYPNYKELTQNVSHFKEAESHITPEQDIVCNFASMQQTTDLISHVAFTSAESSSQIDTPWYFDSGSGCSIRMTGNQDYIEKLEYIKGGKVTFGDGGQGKIRDVGVMERADLPRLINVYFVDGLRANLISVNQLCDEGLEVIFNSKECRAVDSKGNLVLSRVRSGNNCYMWKPSHMCLSARESKLDLWHKKLGHMNTNGLTRLVNAEVVRGVPQLERQTDTVYGECCQGKHVKVQYKQISSKRILELVHMDHGTHNS